MRALDKPRPAPTRIACAERFQPAPQGRVNDKRRARVKVRVAHLEDPGQVPLCPSLPDYTPQSAMIQCVSACRPVPLQARDTPLSRFYCGCNKCVSGAALSTACFIRPIAGEGVIRGRSYAPLKPSLLRWPLCCAIVWPRSSIFRCADGSRFQWRPWKCVMTPFKKTSSPSTWPSCSPARWRR